MLNGKIGDKPKCRLKITKSHILFTAKGLILKCFKSKKINLIAKKITDARKTKGLTQLELAEQSKINLRTLQRIENNINVPRGRTLSLICDALEIDIKEFNIESKIEKNTFRLQKIISIFFLSTVNFVLMGIIGFLTLDADANLNSKLGGFLVSVFIPLFIVVLTRQMTGIERLLKFGLGYVLYFILLLITQGLETGFVLGLVSGLFPCLLISLAVLHFGNEVFPKT
jgi:transcriptional regulator with XRE-family HTH domain